MIALFLVLACASSEPASTPAVTPPAPAPTAAPAVDPLLGKSKAEICADNGLSLIQWDFGTLQADFAGACCGPDGLPDEGICSLDWPFSDVPPCSAYDAMRNHIYARYGYDFQDQVWEQMFESQAWYQQRTDFDPTWLSATATRNVAVLQQLKADQVGCSG